ncbi:MAG: transcription termination/antitermination protein NusG [Acidimicrobiales bacterium]
MTMSEDSELTAEDLPPVDDAPAADDDTADTTAEAETADTAADDAPAADDEAAEADAADSAADDAPAADDEAAEADAPDSAADDAPAAEADTAATEADVIDEDELLAADDEGDAEPAAPRPQSPYDRAGRWYVVHTQSGYEKKVKQNLEARTASMNMEERILEVVIPMDDVVEFKGGKKVVVQKKMFPGYLLVRCHLDDDSWYVIRNTPGIVNFVGAGGKPSPLSRREVETFLHVEDPGAEQAPSKVKARFAFDMGETVRVKEGPFADFSGEIVEINEDQAKVKVLVNIFGRETPVELEFAQVAKL